jgi:hypothetical protein
MNLPFSIYISLPSSIFILIVGLIVWMRSRGKEQTLFLFLSIAQFIWSFGTFIFYEGSLIGKVNDSVLLDKALALSVFLIPVFIYNFTIEFCKCKVRSQRFILFSSYAVAIFFVFVADIKTVVNGVFFYKWGETGYNEGIIHYLFLVFILALLAISLSNLFTTLRKDKSGFRDKLTYVLLAIAIFGLVFIDFLPVYGISIYPVFYLTIPVYALIMAYVLVEKNPLSSLITTDVMVAMVLTLLSSLIIFSDIGITLPERAAIFILISAFSYFILQRSHILAEEKIIFAKELKARTQELEDQSRELMEAKKRLEENNAILEAKVRERTKELQELNNSLGRLVDERTKALKRKTEESEEKIKELEEFGDIFVNRESKMVELKTRIKELEDQLKENE